MANRPNGQRHHTVLATGSNFVNVGVDIPAVGYSERSDSSNGDGVKSEGCFDNRSKALNNCCCSKLCRSLDGFGSDDFDSRGVCSCASDCCGKLLNGRLLFSEFTDSFLWELWGY